MLEEIAKLRFFIAGLDCIASLDWTMFFIAGLGYGFRCRIGLWFSLQDWAMFFIAGLFIALQHRIGLGCMLIVVAGLS